MAVRIDIIGDNPASMTTTTPDRVVINATTKPAVATSSSVQTTVIEVLKGVPGDDRVYVGPTPPPSPFEGQIWIDTSG